MVTGWLWDEYYWFPDNSTGPRYGWKDLENPPGSKEYMPQVRDLHWAIIMGLVLLIIRVIMNRMIVIPVALYLRLSKKEKTTVQRMPVLETEYNIDRTMLQVLLEWWQKAMIVVPTKNGLFTRKFADSAVLPRLSKQTDMTTRHIEVWFRRRSKQEMQTSLQRFTECSWHFVFYSIAFSYGLYVLWDKSWFRETKNCWIGYPRLHVTNDVYWYYMILLGFYWSLTFSLLTDIKRKDLKEMIVHHVATLFLMYFSWMMNYVRLGTIVILVQNASDPWLAIAKMTKYLKFTKTADVCFAVFVLVWTVTRLVIYPCVVLYCATVEPFLVIEKSFFSYLFLNFFLYVLLILHIIWALSIFRTTRNILRGVELNDVENDLDEDIDNPKEQEAGSEQTTGVKHSSNNMHENNYEYRVLKQSNCQNMR